MLMSLRLETIFEENIVIKLIIYSDSKMVYKYRYTYIHIQILTPNHHGMQQSSHYNNQHTGTTR